ncbi:hypothetical protein C0992_005678 [Termitomyces sp. T32_za158]|nr:hypothetical protein C0992_005678 [Termitomyces sp. T32_za158]
MDAREPNNMFETEDSVSPSITRLLSRALEYETKAPFVIIVTNFKDIAVFFPPSCITPQPSFERVSSTQFSLALQVISAACIHKIAPAFGNYGNRPSDYRYLLPGGPVQNPNVPMLSDDEVLATHHRHSDFDIPTLLRNKAQASQFFRWHDRIRRRHSKLVAKPNDVLQAVPNPNAFNHILMRPLYPFDARQLPADTVKHIKETQRLSGLQASGIKERFMRAKSFLVEIQEIITAGSRYGISTVYRCKIVSIDNLPVAVSPNLALKLFDDRAQVFRENAQREVYETNANYLSFWFDSLVMAESLITDEILAYDKLEIVQGSVVPWFYGAHQFTLPDGTVLYGLLMEYIESQEVTTNIEPALSHERQIKMIESCRHAARILNVGDVGQHDWHSGQVLLHTNPMTEVDHVVLVDFGLTMQTYDEDDPTYCLQNYGGMLDVLLYRNPTFDLGLVWKHFGEPDDWDLIDEQMYGRYIKARDIYPFLSVG